MLKFKKYVKNMMKLAKYSKKIIENKVNFFKLKYLQSIFYFLAMFPEQMW